MVKKIHLLWCISPEYGLQAEIIPLCFLVVLNHRHFFILDSEIKDFGLSYYNSNGVQLRTYTAQFLGCGCLFVLVALITDDSFSKNDSSWWLFFCNNGVICLKVLIHSRLEDICRNTNSLNIVFYLAKYFQFYNN